MTRPCVDTEGSPIHSTARLCRQLLWMNSQRFLKRQQSRRIFFVSVVICKYYFNSFFFTLQEDNIKSYSNCAYVFYPLIPKQITFCFLTYPPEIHIIVMC